MTTKPLFSLLASTAVGCVLALGTQAAFATADSHTYTFNFNTVLDVDDPAGNPLDYTTGFTNGRFQFSGSNGTDQISATVSAWRIELDDTVSEVSDDLYRWSSGLGVEQPDSINVNTGDVLSREDVPWHGVDNNPFNCTPDQGDPAGYCDNDGSLQANYTGEEFLVFDFGETNGEDNLVSLHSFMFGYAREATNTAGVYDSHADATVLSGAGVSSIDSIAGNSVTDAGFQLVSNFANVPDAVLSSDNPASQTVTDSGYARYWAVSTLLTDFAESFYNLHWFDAAKLAQIVVKTQPERVPPPPTDVPVPATIALLLFAWFLRGRPRSLKALAA